MRLQVSIRRHGLPPINIIFTTGTGPSSKTLATNSTVTDLLQDINDLVPLESADGEWGLEDYVVELQATADQEFSYECLHFQPIESVLREDDEVVIRALSTEDLRGRRLGGRHQISADGRHLIDGVAFGRQWLRSGGRPAMNIPPRKRRRLEIGQYNGDLDEDSTTLLEQIQQLGYGNDDFDDGSEEDDDDYEDPDEDEISSEDSEDTPRRIKATAEFDDADVEEEDHEDGSAEDDLIPAVDLELSDELKALLEEAEQLSESGGYRRLPSEATQSPRKGKRKHEEDLSDSDGSEFEGFGTPTKPSMDVNSLLSSPSSSSRSEDRVSSSSDADSDSDNDAGPTSSDTSSSGSSSSESDPDTSDEESESDDTSSDSSSDSSSNGDLNTNGVALPPSPAKKASRTANPTANRPSLTSSEHRVRGIPGEGMRKTQRHNSRLKRKKRLAFFKREGLLHAEANFEDLAALEEQMKGPEGVDQSTHDAELLDIDASIENKKAELLQHLDLESEAPGATTNSVKIMSNEGARNVTIASLTTSSNPGQYQLAAPIESNPITAPSQTEQTSTTPLTNTDMIEDLTESVPSQEIGARTQESFLGKVTPRSNEKRAKLDIASSRRMLFNSLGLKNPRTPEAENALREKLNNSAKSTPQRKAEEKVAQKAQASRSIDLNDMDSWKDKITLSAVECEYEGVSLSTPPFPFKQGWDSNANIRRGTKRKAGRGDSRYYNQYADEAEDDSYVAQDAPVGSAPQDPSKSTSSEQDDRPESRTLSLEEQVGDDLPRPTNFEPLPAFDPATLPNGGVGAIIAFKELEIEGFQPVVSPYRVARVESATTEEDSTFVIELMLSKRDWKTGTPEPNPFVVEGADREQGGGPDRGYRLKVFSGLIEPKLVEAASVQVNATPAQAPDVNEETAVVMSGEQSSIVLHPEEVVQDSIELGKPEKKVLRMTHVEINTPRRNEITAIIKEAGFDSAIDKDLLPQKDSPVAESRSSPAFHTRSRSPGPSSLPANTTKTERPRLNSPEQNGWDSSPLHPIPADSSVLLSSQIIAQANKTQSSVAYPSLSQLELDATGVTDTNDSSFQDAQHVSQAPPEIDTSNLLPNPDLDTSKLHPEYPYDDFGETTQQSLGSEVPQSQSPFIPPSSQPKAKGKENDKSNQSKGEGSFLDHGLDGQASFDADVDEDPDVNNYVEDNSEFVSDSSSSSFPSLTDLTSSQHAKIRNASRRSRVTPPDPTSIRVQKPTIISPPPTNRLRNGKKRSISPGLEENLPPPNFPPSSQSQQLKASQSSPPRFSQIPPGSQLVDLTFSSDPVDEPSNDDGEYHAPRTRGARYRKKAPLVAGAVGRSQSTESGSIAIEEDGSGEGGDEENSGAGIGKRKFLTTKRSRSYV